MANVLQASASYQRIAYQILGEKMVISAGRKYDARSHSKKNQFDTKFGFVIYMYQITSWNISKNNTTEKETQSKILLQTPTYWCTLLCPSPARTALWCRHNERDGASNHRRLDCLLNRLFRRRWKKTSYQSFASLAFVTGGFPSQRARNAELYPFDDIIMVDVSITYQRLNERNNWK